MEKEIKRIYLEQIPKTFKTKNIDSRGENIDKCYLTEDKKVFKHLSSIAPFIKEYEFLAKQSSESFAFPETLVFVKNVDEYEFCGYIMEYVEGSVLRTQKRDIDLSKFLSAMKILEKSIKNDISLNSVQMNDLNLGNIIYTPDNLLKVIDTDLYDYDSNPNLSEIHRVNIREYNNSIMAFLLKDIIHSEYKVHCLKELIVATIYGEILASEMLQGYQCFLSNYFQEEIKTLNQMDKKLALIKK